jgi:hypothetical protein
MGHDLSRKVTDVTNLFRLLEESDAPALHDAGAFLQITS